MIRRIISLRHFTHGLPDTLPQNFFRSAYGGNWLDPFDELLDWLDRDREAAAQKYETIRAGLIRVFIFNGFCDAEDLADVTINRVMRRLPTIKEGYVGEPIRYFYGVSRYIIRESNRRKEVATDAFAVAAEMKETSGEAD